MKNIESQIHSYLKERGWSELCPSDVAKSISIESAELLEIFQWTNHSLEEVRANKEIVEKVKEELADIFIYALDMSVLFGFDTEDIILEKLSKVKKKYPATL